MEERREEREGEGIGGEEMRCEEREERSGGEREERGGREERDGGGGRGREGIPLR